jgi:hypothetical protein
MVNYADPLSALSVMFGMAMTTCNTDKMVADLAQVYFELYILLDKKEGE